MNKKFTTKIFPLHIRIYLWFNKIWFNFKASEEEKCFYDQLFLGTEIMKNGKRIDIKKFYNIDKEEAKFLLGLFGIISLVILLVIGVITLAVVLKELN